MEWGILTKMAKKNIFQTIFAGIGKIFNPDKAKKEAAKKAAKKAANDASKLAERKANARSQERSIELANNKVDEKSRPSTSKLAQATPTRGGKQVDYLETMKERLEPIINEANRRVEALKFRNLSSAALLRAEEESGRDYFNLDDLTDRESIIEEATRARVFLADKTSTIEGAKVFTAQLNAAIYKGKFGNQYHNWENKYKNFDISAIDEEIAKEVFRNYRKLEEIRAADIVGDGAYGSENLIIAMYDAQIRGEDSFMAGLEQLDAHYAMKKASWQKRFERSNSVASILGLYEDDSDEYYF